MSEPPYPNLSRKRRRRLSLHALAILFAGFIGIAAWIVSRYSAYRSGMVLEDTMGLLEIALMVTMVVSGALLALSMFVAPFQAILRRKFQPLFAALIVGAIASITYIIPFPTYIDGVAATIGRQDESFYRNLERRLSKLPKPSGMDKSPTIPAQWFTDLPGLTAIFPAHKEPWGEPRVWKTKTHFDVLVGGSLGGTRGFRIYRTNDTPEHLNAAEYAGSFREVYPRVYAYQRFY